MDIRPNQPKSEYDASFHINESAASSVIAELTNNKNKKFKIRRSKVKDVARGLAEIAFNIGETNDPEEFAEEMAENIFVALKTVEDQQKNMKKN